VFTSSEHRPQALGPECYTSREQHETELNLLFRPAWHCIAVTHEVPKDGSFKTVDLFGQPLIVWNHRGSYHTFLNVCAHRFCLLTAKPSGRMPLLKCQYHGWEFDETGNTRRIPDARSFRPLAPGMLCLTKFRTEVCGPMIFVTLSASAPTLREFLGDGYERILEWFRPDMQHCLCLIKELDVNWKIQIENAMESYHTTEVHPRSLGAFPAEDQCRHDFREHWSKLTVDYSQERTFRRFYDAYGHFMTGAGKPRYTYEHMLYYPNFMMARLSLLSWFETLLPIAPGKSLSFGHAYCYGGKPGRLWTWFFSRFVRRFGHAFVSQLAREDSSVLPSVQKGMEAGAVPRGGVISTREERLSHFQQYILQATR
jgi:phenylpropionate dioxygenase-like ring-hydroxylating dioxygenase large terminal subunit